MPGFGSLAPDMGAENDLLSQPQYTYGLPPLQKPAETPPQQGLPPPGWISKAYQDAAPDDWRTREALEGMAGELEANRPSGFRTMWNAIRHPSLAPIIQQVREAQKAQQPPTQEDLAKLPDVGQPLISPGPQISGGTTIGRAIQGPLYEATREALRTGFTDPHEALYGNIPMWDPLTGHTSERMVQAGQNVAALAGGAEGVAGTTERALNAPGRDVRLLGRPLFREPEAGPQISIRTGTGQVLRSDTAAPGAAISIAEHAPQYTTGIEGALSRIPSNELTAAQWANQLKRFGAKPEEMEWRKLGPALEGLGNAKISKAGIEEHLANNPVQLNRIERGASPDRWEDLTPQQQEGVAREGAEVNRARGYEVSPEEYFDEMRRDERLPTDLFPPTKWESYTLPGGENYRERLFQLPETAGLNEGNQAAALAKTLREKYGERWSTEAPPDQINLYHDLLDAADARQRSAQFTNQHGSHWDEPNVLFHRRSTDRAFEQWTPEQQASETKRLEMGQQADDLVRQQQALGRQINAIRRSQEVPRQQQIFNDMRSGKIAPAEADRFLQETPDIPELKSMQDELVALRKQEEEIRRNMPKEEFPLMTKSLHDEENQSDWHQKGRDEGYTTGKE